VVNLASRLCGSAIDTQILLDPVLVNAVRDTIEVKDLGEIFIKGYDKPMCVFAVL
jgi:class 3 adenylate cyclase